MVKTQSSSSGNISFHQGNRLIRRGRGAGRTGPGELGDIWVPSLSWLAWVCVSLRTWLVSAVNRAKTLLFFVGLPGGVNEMLGEEKLGKQLLRGWGDGFCCKVIASQSMKS